MDRQAYIWYLPFDRAAHARRLVEIGCGHVRVKAGGDDGRLWGAWSDPAATQPYRDAGLKVTPWFYTWPTQADIDVVVRAMRAHPFEEYSLNPEMEWRTDSNRNPWNTPAQANEGAADWLRRMEAALPDVRRGFSSVPSWLGFPYEAWCEWCDLAEPQHYWGRELLADVYGKDYDQVGYHRHRGGDAIECIPIITASREYPDAGVVALAKIALADFPRLDGFSCWEAGNSAFQWEAMAACYALLPERIEREIGPEGQYIRSYVDPQTGEARTLINWGGQAAEILGHNAQDIGVSVRGIPPENIYDQSIQANEFRGWNLRP